jgi:hypothetical protein
VARILPILLTFAEPVKSAARFRHLYLVVLVQ